jgi:hypothetical protein
MPDKFQKPRSGAADRFVLSTESKEEFEALAAAYRDEYKPDGPTENHLVEDLVAAEWFQRRYLRIRNVLLDMIRDGRAAQISRNPERTLALLTDFTARHAREYNRAATMLRKIQRERRKTENIKIRNEPGKGLTRAKSGTSKRPIWLN